jgi:hypothetical protein
MKNFTKLSVGLVLVFSLSINQVSAEGGKTCARPYEPSNIFTVIFNYSEGMEYISGADSVC